MRLIDIKVDEVSLVDKAANKKVFAFVKRQDEKPTESKIEEAPKPTVDVKPETTATNVEAAKPTPPPAPAPVAEVQKPVEPAAPKADEPTPEEITALDALTETVIELAESLKG